MDRLREARMRAGYSQKEVSIILKVAAPTVSQWESGIRTPTQKNLIKLADLYGVSTDYLLGKDIKGESICRRFATVLPVFFRGMRRERWMNE